MKPFNWLKQHWFGIIITFLLMIIVIPFFIDKVFSSPAYFTWLGVHYTVGDILSFYGTVLGGAIGGVTALMAVYFTMKYYRKKDSQMEKIKYMKSNFQR